MDTASHQKHSFGEKMAQPDLLPHLGGNKHTRTRTAWARSTARAVYTRKYLLQNKQTLPARLTHMPHRHLQNPHLQPTQSIYKLKCGFDRHDEVNSSNADLLKGGVVGNEKLHSRGCCAG